MINMGVSGKRDYIAFDDRYTTAHQELDLVAAIADARAKALRRLQETGNLRTIDFDNLRSAEESRQQDRNQAGSLEQQRAKRDKEFTGYLWKRAGRAAVWGAFTGLAGGAAAQDVVAVAGRLAGMSVKNTLVESVAKSLGAGGQKIAENIGAGKPWQEWFNGV